MLRMTNKIKTDSKYREKIFTGHVTKKVMELKNFVRNVPRTIRRLKFVPVQKNKDYELDLVIGHLNCIEKPMQKGSRNNHKKLRRQSEDFLAQTHEDKDFQQLQEVIPENFDENARMRSKSCCCGECGGPKYYKNVQRKLIRISSIVPKNEFSKKSLKLYFKDTLTAK